MSISSIIKLMRPHQYIKNLFIFLPLFFALKITDPTLLTNAFIAFIASAIYTLNDYFSGSIRCITNYKKEKHE